MRNLILSFLLVQTWRRLPPKVRQAVLLKLNLWRAPRISSTAKAGGPIIVVGMLSQASGLGAAARACHDALKAAGLPVYGVDLTTRMRQEANHSGFTFRDGHGIAGQGTVLLHISGPLVPSALTHLGRTFVRKKRIVAHWFWELPRVPKNWLPAVRFVHEICVNTRFVADAIYPIADGKPVHIVSYPLTWAGEVQNKDQKDKPFTVLVIFNIASNFTRKNPCAAISAFRHAFGNDRSAQLIVKYMGAAYWPQGVREMQMAAGDALNITLIGEVLNDADMDALYERADAVMSLHRSEGLGLTIAEGMLRGLPVIATDWSGNTDFLSRETGIPVGYRLVPVDDPKGDYADQNLLWAEPNINEAAEALRALRADTVWRQMLGAAAATHASTFFLPKRYAEQIQEFVSG